MSEKSPVLTIDVKLLRETFIYDETSPTCLRRLKDSYGGRDYKLLIGQAGDVVGSCGNGRSQIWFNGTLYHTSRVIWCMHYGDIPEDYVVDHRDGNIRNNKIKNLRAVSGTVNRHNSSLRSDNKTGITGVMYRSDSKDAYFWVARWDEDIKRGCSKWFSEDKYGYEVAKQKAIDFRKSKILELNSNGIGFYTERHGLMNIIKRRPSLCCDVCLEKVPYPVLGFPKIDGVRIINLSGSATARSLLPHANLYTTQRFSASIYRGIDGEGAVGEERSSSLCRDTTSALNTIKGEPDIIWHAFDFLREDVIGLTYINRYKALQQFVSKHRPHGVRVIPSKLIKNEAQLISFYKKCLAEGYEGAVFRDPMGLHKDGRCTANEGAYLRMKPSSDKEAIVLSIVEAQKNNNEKKTNALGHSERSSHKENKSAKGMVGSLICKDVATDSIITVMAGKMKHSERIHYFQHPEEIVNQYVKYRSTDTGVKDAPRFGRFICIRSKEDAITNESTTSFFEQTPDGKLIGYHCEGGETFEYGGSTALTMKSLDNNRPLFLGNNCDEWIPRHLNLKNYRLYKITFDQPSKVMVFKSFHEYQSLFDWNSKDKRYVWSEELEKLFDQGYRLFVLDKNDLGELTEAFLVCPKEYVKSIIKHPLK